MGVNCHLSISLTLLNSYSVDNSVELSSNLDPEPLKSGIGTPPLIQSFELLSGSIGWGADLKPVG